ncbi:hypothetical protein PCV59_001127 [Staphylococcus pseudintermedius]|nr:hypothetical protein [Staphylococcus pseudintermedius]EKO8622970.1 hypothetical protein [Staphylococcus pseudintermedius]
MLMKNKYDEKIKSEIEDVIFFEITEYDAIDKWAPMVKQIERGEEITFHPRVESGIDIFEQMEQLRNISKIFAKIIYDKCTVEQFEYWIIPEYGYGA